MTGKSENWRQFFDQHAPFYMNEPFVANTIAEVDFLVEHLHLTQEMQILDMGCGTGRHAIELGKRGYSVTGVDLSDGMLDQARQAADAAGVTNVRFQQGDATQFQADRSYDSVYCVCEGSLGLIGQGSDPHAHDLAVLTNLYQALKPGGRMLITVINAMRHIRMYSQQDVEDGLFDPLTSVERGTIRPGDDPEAPEIPIYERGFIPSELRLMLMTIGFQVEHIGGGTAGNWGIRPVELDEYELLAIVTKPA